MRIDIRRPWLGNLLFLALGLALSSCRESTPPPLEICILDGHGGGDCIESDGSRLYRVPSSMANYWATNEPDQRSFSAWCYDGNPVDAANYMNQIKRTLK